MHFPFTPAEYGQCMFSKTISSYRLSPNLVFELKFVFGSENFLHINAFKSWNI